MHQLVKELVELGVELTLMKGRDGEMVWDLHSQTKSGMYMSVDEQGPLTVTGRYDEKDEVENLKDLLYVFAKRYEARAGQPGFGSRVWLDLAVEHGVLKRKEKVTVEYEYV